MKIKNLLIAIAIFLFPLTVKAKNIKDVNYVVKNIRVNETAKNATQARNKAIQKGQKQAFDILLNRMEIDKKHSFWISDEEIEKMVGSIKISKEKIAKNNYSAVLDITFDEKFTKYIFNKHNITPESKVKSRYLAIPMTTKDGVEYIWEKENMWLQSWQKLIKDRGIKSIVVPERNIDSLASINKDIISFDDTDDFNHLTEYYDVDSIIILNAEHLKDEQKIEIMFTKITQEEKSKVKLNFFSSKDLDLKTLYLNATDKTINYIIRTENEEALKARSEDGMIVKVSISDIEDYLQMDKIMKQLDFLDSVKLNYLSKKTAEYHIKYSMSDVEVLTKFEEYGFYIREKDDGHYLFLKAKYNLGAIL